MKGCSFCCQDGQRRDNIPLVSKETDCQTACWQDFLAEFDFTFEYKPGKANVVADTHSRKAAIVSSNFSTVVDEIREGMQHDPMAKQLLILAQQGKTKILEEARIFLRDVIKYWGIHKHIITDRDPRFNGTLWTELFSLLGSELHFSTSFHPHTDGQTERINVL